MAYYDGAREITTERSLGTTIYDTAEMRSDFRIERRISS
jgi:hypothetical protein